MILVQYHTCERCNRTYWTRNQLQMHACDVRARKKTRGRKAKPDFLVAEDADDSMSVARAWLAEHGAIADD